MSLTPGTRLGVYDITAQIGVGGMGEVYRARDLKLNRDVAIKVLLAGVANDPDRLARFQREAQVLAALNHPHIAHIHGFEDSTGVPALVMELVEGPTLADRIAHGRIPTSEALAIARQIADALETAHELGIIHRDLKPANIKVRDDGTVKVLDFGLAKAMDPSAATTAQATMSPTLSMHATQAGIILGTAAYMSPEQARGKTVDRRADIWAFGVILFEMLTNQRAFEGDDISITLAAVLKDDLPWNALPADTPAHIRTLLRRCLQKDPQKRLPHIGVARIEIDEGSGLQEPPRAEPPLVARSLWKRVGPLVAGMVATAAITSAAWWTLRSSGPSPSVARFTMTVADQIVTGGSRQMAIAPDGTKLVYIVNNQRMYLRALADVDARPILGTENIGNLGDPVFSPDGQWIAFSANGDRKLKRIAVTGGAPVTIGDIGPPLGISWGSDGIVFVQGSQGIMRVSAEGGPPQLLVSTTTKDANFPTTGDEQAYGPQVLPDGDHVLFTLVTGAGSDRKVQIVVQSVKSGERKVLVADGAEGRYVPTGHLVYAVGGALFAVRFNPARTEMQGGPVPVVEGVSRSGARVSAHFSVSNTGVLIYVPGPAVLASGGERDLALIDRQGVTQPLKLPPAPYVAPRISPDGARIAVGTEDDKDASIWIYDLAGTRARRRLTFGGKNRFPVWSADGKRVAYQSDREGDLGLFWQFADGTGVAERLTRAEQGTSQTPDSWSRQGDGLLFSVTKGLKRSLWIFSLAEHKVTPFGGVESAVLSNAVFSPDGKWVAYTSNEAGTAVYVQPFPATGAKYQMEGGIHPLWSRDGKELFFGRVGARLLTVSVLTRPTFTFGKPVESRLGQRGQDGGPNTVRNFDITPDGKQFLAVVDAGRTQSGLPTTQIQIVMNWFEELKARVPSK